MTDVDPITCTDRTHYFQPSVNGVQPTLCYCGKRDSGEMRGVVVLIEGTLTVPADSPGALLVRAADRLDELDRYATPFPWLAGETYQNPDLSSGDVFADILAPESATSPVIVEVDEGNAAIICALRAVVSPLSRWLRAEADVRMEDFPRRYGRAADIARAILGEEVPW